MGTRGNADIWTRLAALDLCRLEQIWLRMPQICRIIASGNNWPTGIDFIGQPTFALALFEWCKWQACVQLGFSNAGIHFLHKIHTSMCNFAYSFQIGLFWLWENTTNSFTSAGRPNGNKTRRRTLAIGIGTCSLPISWRILFFKKLHYSSFFIPAPQLSMPPLVAIDSIFFCSANCPHIFTAIPSLVFAILILSSGCQQQKRRRGGGWLIQQSVGLVLHLHN